MQIQQIQHSRIKEINYQDFPFGTCFTDHMFKIVWKNGAWQEGSILPYGPMEMQPSLQALHYGQVFFEGMKAYRSNDDITMFRPLENAKRFNTSAERLCMPELPESLFMEGLSTLLDIDRDWVPSSPTASLYIRPFMFASGLGVKASFSDEYTAMIICCPVEAYYQKPVRLYAEPFFVRAAVGGTGNTKAGGNYAASFAPAKKAKDKGYDQIMWLDAVNHENIEEAGTMNIFFRLGDTLVTPSLSGSILPGITRASIITLAKDLGIEVEERIITLKEIQKAHSEGLLKECFGSGTAATIAPVSAIGTEHNDMELPSIEKNSYSTRIKDHLEGVKRGTLEDKHQWLVTV